MHSLTFGLLAPCGERICLLAWALRHRQPTLLIGGNCPCAAVSPWRKEVRCDDRSDLAHSAQRCALGGTSDSRRSHSAAGVTIECKKFFMNE